MFARAFAVVALTSLSACVLTTNEAIDTLRIGMSVAEAESILGEPTTVRDLGVVEGTIPAKNIVRECRTYRYLNSDSELTEQTNRFTWVTYNAGRVAGFSDNGYADDNRAYCHR